MRSRSSRAGIQTWRGCTSRLLSRDWGSVAAGRDGVVFGRQGLTRIDVHAGLNTFSFKERCRRWHAAEESLIHQEGFRRLLSEKEVGSETHVQMMSAVWTAAATASSSEVSSVAVTRGKSAAMSFARVLARVPRLRTTSLSFVTDGKSSRIKPARENISSRKFISLLEKTRRAYEHDGMPGLLIRKRREPARSDRRGVWWRGRTQSCSGDDGVGISALDSGIAQQRQSVVRCPDPC
jgi:hypothetical protein